MSLLLYLFPVGPLKSDSSSHARDGIDDESNLHALREVVVDRNDLLFDTELESD